MAPIPLRFLFRSRWAALAWAAGICWTVASYVGGDSDGIDAANSADSIAAVNNALLAEGPS